MALTVTPHHKTASGLNPTRRVISTITVGVAGDYSSGITLAASDFGLRELTGINVLGASIGVLWQWDSATRKLRAYKTGSATSGLLLEAAGADVAATTVTVEAIEIL